MPRDGSIVNIHLLLKRFLAHFIHLIKMAQKFKARLTNTCTPFKFRIDFFINKNNLYKIIASLEQEFVNNFPPFLLFEII